MFLFKLLKEAHVKSLILGFMILLGHDSVLAYDFVVDRLYYNILSPTDLTCEVTYKDINDYNTYSGKITIPSEVTYKGKTLTVVSIGEAAFFHNENLLSVTIPESIKSIGSSAFQTCSGLTALSIPPSVNTIGYSAFAYCKNLEIIVFEDGENPLSLYPTSFASEKRSPFTVTGGNSKINYMYIGRNLYNLHTSTFDVLTELRTLEIGKYVKGIGGNQNNKVSFKNSTKLSKIYTFCANPPVLNNYIIGENFFSNRIYADAKVKVPKGTLDRYQNDKEWGKFWDIEEGDWESPIILTLTLSDSELTLDIGDKIKIDALIEPVALNKNVSWSSSNPIVATVDDKGNVEALCEGNTIITCVTTDGSNLSATCSIIVDEESRIDTILADISSVICIYDLCGTLVFKGSLNDLNLPKGIYIIRDGNKYKKILVSGKRVEPVILNDSKH